MDIEALLVGFLSGVGITIGAAYWGGISPDHTRPLWAQPLSRRKPPKVGCEETVVPDAKANTENTEDDWIAKEAPAVREYLAKEIENRVLTAVKDRREGKKDRRRAIA